LPQAILITDLSQDRNNCGGCNLACAPFQICTNVTCAGNQLCQPAEQQSCATGLPGVCAQGIRVCGATGTSWSACVPTTSGTSEVCDGLDNDCDGQTDEGVGDGAACVMPDQSPGVTVCRGAQGFFCIAG